MLLSPDDLPVPHEYRHMSLGEVITAPPDDALERTVVLLDCGNIDRAPIDFVRGADVHVLNIDHHHDNTRFGSVNLVRPEASCTAEIVFELARELGVEVTHAIAEPLYIGLVTDTGRFSHENVTPEAHHMAAELIDAGVEPTTSSRGASTRSCPTSACCCCSTRSPTSTASGDGLITATVLTREDFEAAAAERDRRGGHHRHLRSVEGTSVAVLVRDRLDAANGGMRKVSLRADDRRVDVSRIARGLGGGGHRRRPASPPPSTCPRYSSACARRSASSSPGSGAGALIRCGGRPGGGRHAGGQARRGDLARRGGARCAATSAAG